MIIDSVSGGGFPTEVKLATAVQAAVDGGGGGAELGGPAGQEVPRQALQGVRHHRPE